MTEMNRRALMAGAVATAVAAPVVAKAAVDVMVPVDVSVTVTTAASMTTEQMAGAFISPRLPDEAYLVRLATKYEHYDDTSHSRFLTQEIEGLKERILAQALGEGS